MRKWQDRAWQRQKEKKGPLNQEKEWSRSCVSDAMKETTQAVHLSWEKRLVSELNLVALSAKRPP